ncbi:MAG: leucine-rich repeat domain-containing protein, partial [Clostridiales bacterium]|nr:leucine-rich repeat domain-containing protein [Clostridiales bacterium]
MKGKIINHLTKYILPVLALVIAVPVATAFIGTEVKSRVLADTPALQPGENTVPFIHGEVVEYSFTPSESGYYTFWSEGNYDPMATLARADFSVSDDDKGDNRNFRLFVKLSAGETYQIGFKLWDEIEGSVDIVVKVNKGLDSTSGTCGGNATWTFDEETDILIISGTGAMYNFDEKPWEDIKQFVETVKIEDEITYISNRAFSGCENISSLTIGSGVTSIGESAFSGCKGLTEVVIPNNVTSIGKSAFSGCENISS